MDKKQFYRDKQWREYNKNLLNGIKEEDWLSMSITCRDMARFVEEEGKDGDYLREDAVKYLRIHFKMELENYLQSGVIGSVEIYANIAKDKDRTACESCAHTNGNIFTIKEALQSSPLPNTKCTNKLYDCRCRYLPVIEEI